MSNKGIHYAWVVLFSACIIMGVAIGIPGQCAGIFFTPVAQELGFGRGPLAFYMTVQSICTMITLIFAGRLLPKLNFRMVQSLAAIVLMSGFMAMSQYHSLTSFYTGGVIMGIALGFTGFLAVPVMLSNWFKAKTGLVIGIAMAFTGVGGAVFNMVGSLLIKDFGWRGGYLYLGLIGLILLLPCTIFLVRFKPADKGVSAYGEEQLSGEAGVTQQQVAAAFTGVSAARALRTPSFWLIFIAAGLFAFNGIFTQHIPSYVISLGWTMSTGAAMISIIMLVSIGSKIAIGWLNDKIGIISASTISIIIAIAGLVLFLIGGKSTAMLFAGSALFGFGMSTSAIEPPLLVRQVFGAKDYSTIFSYVMMALNLMVGVGVTVFGFIFDIVGPYGPAIMVVIASYITIVVSIIVSITLGRKLVQE